MKKAFLIIFIFIFSCECSYSQADSSALKNITQSLSKENKTSLEFDKEYYIRKSISFNKTGNKLLLVGSALILGGIIIASDRSIDLGKAVAAVGIMSVGTITNLISIPFFISSNHNTKLAKLLP